MRRAPIYGCCQRRRWDARCLSPPITYSATGTNTGTSMTFTRLTLIASLIRVAGTSGPGGLPTLLTRRLLNKYGKPSLKTPSSSIASATCFRAAPSAARDPTCCLLACIRGIEPAEEEKIYYRAPSTGHRQHDAAHCGRDTTLLCPLQRRISLHAG